MVGEGERMEDTGAVRRYVADGYMTHCYYVMYIGCLESPHISLDRSRPSTLSDKELLSLLLQ